MGKPLKFPSAGARSKEAPAVLCTADRVLGLYNQANKKKPAKRISKTVREWFQDHAETLGWDGVGFIPEAQSLHGAGCILWVRHNHPKTIPQAALVLLVAAGVEN